MKHERRLTNELISLTSDLKQIESELNAHQKALGIFLKANPKMIDNKAIIIEILKFKRDVKILEDLVQRHESFMKQTILRLKKYREILQLIKDTTERNSMNDEYRQYQEPRRSSIIKLDVLSRVGL